MKIDHQSVAVVVGGASGLGEATARMLRQNGAKVAILDMNERRGETLAAEIGAVFCKTNITEDGSVEAALAAARKANSVERILVNCAGISTPVRVVTQKRDSGEFVSHDLSIFEQILAVNLAGTFRMIAKSALQMAQTEPVTADGGRGVIINTASIAAVDGQIGQVAYSASKGGILGMTLPLARDLARYGIRVMTIMPGSFHTPMFDTLSDEIRQRLEADVPFPSRLGRPEEYAALVKSIIENDMLNGESIRLDGGVRMQPR
jgi:NAD(P)-dependent dehydrogenase (short-subunit alcohol dehydrogenase family)